MKSLPTILTALLLAASTTPASTNVSGTIGTQTWTAAGSPYVLTADVTVLPGETLTIEPGVDVNLSNGTLKIAGRFDAQGTESDSVRFEGGRIEFLDAMPSVLRYTLQRGATTTSYGLGNDTFLGGGMVIDNSVVLMEHCVVEGNVADMSDEVGVVYGGGTAIVRGSQVTLRESVVRNNEIYSRGADGSRDENPAGTARGGGLWVDAESGLTLDMCEVIGNRVTGQGGGGVSVDGTLRAYNTVFSRNRLVNIYWSYYTCCDQSLYWMRGLAVEGGNTADALLVNCTIAQNRAEQSFSSKRWTLFGPIALRNCIVWGNTSDTAVAPVVDRYLVVATYTDIVDGLDLPDGVGNISADPLFADTSAYDYSLLAGSACIDAGDPGSPQDADGTNADMGVSTGTHVAGHIVSAPTVTLSTGSEGSVWVANHGSEAVNVTGVDLPDGWSTTATLPATLTPESIAGIPLSRTPSSSAEGTVTIHHDADGQDPLTVAVEFGPESVLPSLITTRTLTTDHSPYTLALESEIPAGETLTIEAGVEIQMTVDASLTVRGELVANGAAGDQIRFRQATSEGRGPINVRDGGSASLQFTVIRDGNCENGGAMRVFGAGTTVHLAFCSLVDNIGYREYPQYFYENPYHGTGGALHIDGGAEVTATDCAISRNVSGVAGAIHVYDGTLNLVRCVITENEHKDANYPITRKYAPAIALDTGSHAVLDHCTALMNKDTSGLQPLDLYFQGSSLEISNSAMYYAADASAGPVTDTYGYLTTVTTALDDFYNSLFVDVYNGDFSPAVGSPLIDAGDPNSPNDPDGSRTDIGAVPYGERFPAAVEQSAQPLAFNLAQNVPNPFNPRTTLRFSTAEPGAVRLAIYDVNGRHVRELVNRHMAVGRHEAVWDSCDDAGRAVASGVYVYRLVTKDHSAVQRMTLIR